MVQGISCDKEPLGRAVSSRLRAETEYCVALTLRVVKSDSVIFCIEILCFLT